MYKRQPTNRSLIEGARTRDGRARQLPLRWAVQPPLIGVDLDAAAARSELIPHRGDLAVANDGWPQPGPPKHDGLADLRAKNPGARAKLSQGLLRPSHPGDPDDSAADVNQNGLGFPGPGESEPVLIDVGGGIVRIPGMAWTEQTLAQLRPRARIFRPQIGKAIVFWGPGLRPTVVRDGEIAAVWNEFAPGCRSVEIDADQWRLDGPTERELSRAPIARSRSLDEASVRRLSLIHISEPTRPLF